MEWIKRPIDSRRVKELAERFSIDLLTAAIFVRRGVDDPAQMQFFLEDDLRFLHNPFLFEEMADAVMRISQAESEGERIHVFGDRDADGISSTVLMVEALQALGLEVSWGVPMGDDAYGITRDVIDEIAANDVTLLIAVDCGTSNADEVAYASDIGIDTIIIDHHNPQEARPPAIAIINPKMPDETYPFPGLCACALVSKVRYALAFSRTDFFNEPVCLLNAKPGNDSVVLEAVKLENMVELDRITESLVPGVIDVESSRLGAFLQGMPLLVFDATAQDRLLRQAFGPGVDIGVVDVAPEIRKTFPSIGEKSLLRLKDESRVGRYTGTEPSEIEAFLSLFTAYVSRREKEVSEDLVSCLDLVAMATLADMMPLTDENRILVTQGLRRMSSAPRPGLRSLLEKLRLLGKTIVAKDVGWSISPVINSSGRMGEPDLSVRLLLEEEDSKRSALATDLFSINEKRKQTGEGAWDLVLSQATASLEQSNDSLILVRHQELHRGITGLLAGRLARHFDVPAVAISLLPEKAVGSVRAVRGFVVTDFLSQFDDLLVDWGGHDQAGGFTLPLESVDALAERMYRSAADAPIEDVTDASVEIDAEIPRDMLSKPLYKVIDAFSPYGQQNQTLHFLVRGLTLNDLTFMGKEQNHLRLTLDSGATKWPAVFWRAADKVGVEFAKGDTVDAVVQVGTNFYQGVESPQLTIIDIKRVVPSHA